MARFVFLAFVLVLDCSAIQVLHAQENAGNGTETPVIRGVEGAEPDAVSPSVSAQQPQVDSTTDQKAGAEIVSVAPKLAKNKGFYEEIFSNPLNYGLVLIVCLYVYLIFMQPKGGRREQREIAERLKNLKKNDRVITTGGIHGIVSNINSEAGTITLRVDENSNAKLTIDRSAIRSVMT